MSHLAIAEQMIAHSGAQDADAYVALMSEDACEASYRGAVQDTNAASTPVRPELVEGLPLFFGLGAWGQKKSSPSTSSGRSDIFQMDTRRV